MKPLQAVRVDWVDIQQNSNWKSLEEAGNSHPIPCVTIGFLLRIDKEHGNIILAHNQTDDNQVDHTIIPLGVVRRIRWMRQGKDFPDARWKL